MITTRSLLTPKEKWVDSVYQLLTPDQRIGQLYMQPVYPAADGTKSSEEMISLIKDSASGDEFLSGWYCNASFR